MKSAPEQRGRLCPAQITYRHASDSYEEHFYLLSHRKTFLKMKGHVGMESNHVLLHGVTG